MSAPVDRCVGDYEGPLLSGQVIVEWNIETGFVEIFDRPKDVLGMQIIVTPEAARQIVAGVAAVVR